MDDYRLLVDLHRHAKRQGPGGDAETKRAIELAGLDPRRPLRIADIGCGTGASTLQLARSLKARISALDLMPTFVEELERRARREGLSGSIDALVGSMDELPFAQEAFDVIWSEGAIYSIGFEHGVEAWRRFLKPGGLLAVSEITWTTGDRPQEIEDYWHALYPEIDTASAKIQVLERHGYSPVGYFVLPERCWLENYYRPLEGRFSGFLSRNASSEEARQVVESERREIALYEKYRAFYSYGFYLARRVD